MVRVIRLDPPTSRPPADSCISSKLHPKILINIKPRSGVTTWYKFQVGIRTVKPRFYTNIELPNDRYSDYH